MRSLFGDVEIDVGTSTVQNDKDGFKEVRQFYFTFFKRLKKHSKLWLQPDPSDLRIETDRAKSGRGNAPL